MKTTIFKRNIPGQGPDHRRKKTALSLLPILVVAGLLMACGSSPAAITATAPPTSHSGQSSQASTPSDQPTSQTSLAVTASALPATQSVLPDEPLAAIIQAMKAEFKAVPLRETESIDGGGGGEPFEMTVEYESLARILMVTQSGSFKTVDGKYYQLKGDAWVDFPEGATAMTGLLSAGNEAQIDAFFATVQTANRLNDETIDGQATRHYEYAFTSDQSGVHSEGTVEVWISEATGLPVKQVSVSESSGYTATTTTTIVYDPTIKVTAP